uniref:ATP-dependent RNA helicase n=1 Tax=Myripristis murdjan TaxID=586833 RepID=A0A667Y2B4_9TELE
MYHSHTTRCVFQAPPPQPQRKAEKKKREGEEGGKETGRSIKTSSLFKHNPDIPHLHRPTVSQLKEQIFTSDSFTDLDLHPHLVATLNKVLNVSTLTSVQKQTIPALLSGRDAVVRSQTGSGKTLCYAVPVVQGLQSVQPKITRADGPLALVIVPTREVLSALRSLHLYICVLCPTFTWIVPGVLMGGGEEESREGQVCHLCGVCVCVCVCVLCVCVCVVCVCVCVSGLSRLADVCMNDPVNIQVSGPAPSDLVTPVTADTAPAGQSESFAVPEALNQFVVVVPSKVRLVCLAAFILDKCKVRVNKLIVFVSSCEAVEFLLSVFSSVLGGPSANHSPALNFLRLHGNMKQEERTEVFQEFSVCTSGVLLCTDVAARGLDLPQVTWIVQYTPPSSAAEYVHRVGRTARIGGRGSSLLFLAPAETAYLTELANHNISLSEMKLLDILSCLMLDDAYKGRGKYHSKTSSVALDQEIKERATVLQTEFENFVHANTHMVQTAKKALQSFLRAYTAYPAALKHVFHIRRLHLGHAAKSFGLRDAPHDLGAPGGPKTARGPGTKARARGQAPGKGTQKR